MASETSRVRSGRPPSTVPPSRGGMVSSTVRPLTQQGLTGARPIHTGNAVINRMYKDKRYYVSVMQAHMNTIREELSVLRKNTTDYRTTGANRLVERRAAGAYARRFYDGHEQLSTYNAVLELQASQEKSDKLAYETTLLKEKNKHAFNELDGLISSRVRREETLVALKKDIADEDQVAQKIVDSFSQEDKVKYMEALKSNQKSTQTIKELQTEINRYKEALKGFQDNLSENQNKREHLRLLENLERLKDQKETLLVNLEETQTPAQQRVTLVQQVKSDRIDTESLSKVKTILEQELVSKKEKFTELEIELNEKNTGRLKKHKELREREEFMSKFIGSFDEKSVEVRQRIVSVRKQIILALDHLSNSVDDLNFEELDNIQSTLHQSPLESLSNQFALFSSRLARLKAFKEKYQTELATLKEKKMSMNLEMYSLNNPEKARDDLTLKSETSLEKSESLRQTLTTTTAAVVEAERYQSDLEGQLFGNEHYRQIQTLEKQLEDVEKENQFMRSALSEMIYSVQVTKKLQEIQELVSKRNDQLISALRVKKPKSIDNDSFLDDMNEPKKISGDDSGRPPSRRITEGSSAKSYRLKKPDNKTEILEFDTGPINE